MVLKVIVEEKQGGDIVDGEAHEWQIDVTTQDSSVQPDQLPFEVTSRTTVPAGYDGTIVLKTNVPLTSSFQRNVGLPPGMFPYEKEQTVHNLLSAAHIA